jgi:hypothetical protein
MEALCGAEIARLEQLREGIFGFRSDLVGISDSYNVPELRQRTTELGLVRFRMPKNVWSR